MNRFKKWTYCEKSNKRYEIVDVTDKYLVVRTSSLRGKNRKYKLEAGWIENGCAVIDGKVFRTIDFVENEY